jgi:hypothetical protein
MLLPFSKFWPTFMRLDAGAVHRQSLSAYEFSESCTLLAEIKYICMYVCFKPTIGNERLHQDSNDNGVRIINFATSKNLVVKSTMFPHRNIYKYTRTSPDVQTHNQIDHILIDRRRHSSILDV